MTKVIFDFYSPQRSNGGTDHRICYVRKMAELVKEEMVILLVLNSTVYAVQNAAVGLTYGPQGAIAAQAPLFAYRRN